MLFDDMYDSMVIDYKRKAFTLLFCWDYWRYQHHREPKTRIAKLLGLLPKDLMKIIFNLVWPKKFRSTDANLIDNLVLYINGWMCKSLPMLPKPRSEQDSLRQHMSLINQRSKNLKKQHNKSHHQYYQAQRKNERYFQRQSQRAFKKTKSLSRNYYK